MELQSPTCCFSKVSKNSSFSRLDTPFYKKFLVYTRNILIRGIHWPVRPTSVSVGYRFHRGSSNCDRISWHWLSFVVKVVGWRSEISYDMVPVGPIVLVPGKDKKVKCSLWGSRYIDPHFLDLGTSWRWMVSFTLRPLYPWEENPRYLLDRRLGGPQSRSRRCGEEKILDPTGILTLTPRSFRP
jgi:hypothetical protein